MADIDNPTTAAQRRVEAAEDILCGPQEQVNTSDIRKAMPDSPTTRRGIYVASRASLPERGAMWRMLRDLGWPIVSTWIDEDGEGETGDFGDLWSRIQREVTGAAGLVLYAETDDFPLKGALIEVGMAIGANVPVVAVLPGVRLAPRSMRPVGSWLAHPGVKIADCLEAARKEIDNAAA